MILKPSFKPIEEHKTLFNIGATFDIPTGYWMRGLFNENILMGGLGPLTSVCGPGNMFKSTILHYQMLSAMSRIWEANTEMSNVLRTSCATYDSETNIHIQRLKTFASNFPQFKDIDVIEEGHWVISDAGTYLGDEWYKLAREFMNEKRKNNKSIQVLLPFNNKNGNRATEVMPTFSELDSISAMHMSAAADIMDKNSVGSSGGSHVFMREGLGKAQMLHELPSLAAAAKQYILSTAHIGANTSMSQGPMSGPPKKQLQYIPADIKIKGITPQFLYNQHNLWLVTNCSVLWNKDDKTPKFPKFQGQAVPEDKDLNIVTMQHVRGKAGPSGFRLDIVLSQSEGVLPSLTEFTYLKDHESFGFDGNDRTYNLFLCPDEKLQRTTVRQKLDNSKKLRRAMNITSELAQMYQFHKPYIEDKLMTADILYNKLKERGYDIEWILENTRGWWTYNNELVGDFYLSTLDLLEMANDKYHPYWLEADKKTIKKAFLRKVK